MPTRREDPVREKPLGAIDRVRRRVWIAHLLEGSAAGLALGAGLGALVRYQGWHAGSTTMLVALAAAGPAILWLIVRRHHRSQRAAAATIEAALAGSRNVIVTAEELIRCPERARPWMRDRVVSDAERLLAGVEPRAILSLRLRTVAWLFAFGVAGAAVLVVHEPAGRAVSSGIHEIGSTAPGGGSFTIVAILQPPAHTNLPSTRLRQPERISAVEGTRLSLAITGTGSPSQVRFGTMALPTRSEGKALVTELTLRDSGYVAIESHSEPKLIPVAVTKDRAPAITIEKPGRDLLLPNAARVVAVEATATDDFGLAQLSLRYTKASGSGEQFEFVEGELPLSVLQQDSRSWRGRGELSLARLGLEPGDSIVYRVVARDGRAGDEGAASSDSFFIEVAGPGQVPLEGFEMPPDRERYALSQQMIVLKIQRLREREQALARSGLQDQTATIAAEQRAVRAGFIFLMGGQVEDEEEEAERSTEIQEGRLENTGRREISRAITYMTHAERGLAAVDTADALKQAKLAVEALQRAFGKNRYILRSLAVRSRVDLSRRLTGKLDDAGGWTRTLPEPSPDPRVQGIRHLLVQLISIAEHLTEQGKEASAAAIARLAERALAIDPADARWQQISSKLGILREAVVSGEPRDDLNRRIREALDAIAVEARRVSTPRGLDPGTTEPLRGAWAEELRRSRPQR